MSGHTKGPLRLDGEGTRAMVRGADSTIVACRHRNSADRNMADMRRIVLCWNSHDDLLEALEYAVEKYGKTGGPWNVPMEPGSWIAQARAAIAKAKGEA